MSNSIPIRIGFPPGRIWLKVSSISSASMNWSANPKPLSKPRIFRTKTSPSRAAVSIKRLQQSTQESFPVTSQTPFLPHFLNPPSIDSLAPVSIFPEGSSGFDLREKPAAPTTFTFSFR